MSIIYLYIMYNIYITYIYVTSNIPQVQVYDIFWPAAATLCRDLNAVFDVYFVLIICGLNSHSTEAHVMIQSTESSWQCASLPAKADQPSNLSFVLALSAVFPVPILPAVQSISALIHLIPRLILLELPERPMTDGTMMPCDA